MLYDPPGDGNCQFGALAYLLAKIGIYCSYDTLRNNVVDYLNENPNDDDEWPLELYIGRPWNEYVKEMSRAGTFGDVLTLRVVSSLFNVEIEAISLLGEEACQVISPNVS